MSKQATAKLRQGYVAKAQPRTCAYCRHFTREQIPMSTPWRTYLKDTNLRCALGGFKVMKMGTCNAWCAAPLFVADAAAAAAAPLSPLGLAPEVCVRFPIFHQKD